MTRYFNSILMAVILLLGGAIPAMAHGGEETTFNAENNVKQAIVTIVQKQPNIGVIEMKLDEVIKNKGEAGKVDITKVEEALKLVKDGKYEKAKSLMFASIAENPDGKNPNLGSPFVEYEKEFSPDKAVYLLLASAIFFVGIGGLILKQQRLRG
ncbi:hypothetical protein ACQYAD_11780 [Neobacillus sp. SM06]|uniref:hypothetical protein n=1 Tax=Neobacillus sp. SM06 TaxID=3422492 RepID=UPI003D2BB98D